MARRILKGDLVKIISGDNKGETARVLKVMTDKNQVLLEGIGDRVRHVAKSQINPTGGKKDIRVPINISKVALVVDEKTNKTSRVGYKLIDGKKVRVARQLNNTPVKVYAPKIAKTASNKKGAK